MTMWRETTRHERNAKIFREELDRFLPGKILDFHVHAMNAGVLPAGQTYCCAGHEIAGYTVDELSRDLAEVYPGRETAAVCLIVVLHISRKGRLADPDNRRELAGLCRRFPGAKIVLAHVGRAEINDGYTCVTPVPWKLSIVAGPERVTFTSFLYEQLRAVRRAAGRLGLGEKFLRGFFWENGMRLLSTSQKG